jgi:hypothetical protein
MHDYLSTLFWWNAGKYAALGVWAGAAWLTRQTWLPHRHDGYVSMNGYVRKCTRCGRLPAGAVRAGFYGTEPDSPAARRYDEIERAYEADHAAPANGAAATERRYCENCGGYCPSDDSNERNHDDSEPCECPNATGYGPPAPAMTREQAGAFWDQASPDVRTDIACLALDGVDTVRAVEIIAQPGCGTDPPYECPNAAGSASS